MLIKDSRDNSLHFRIDLSLDLIQEIRLVHALMESKYMVHLSPQQIERISVLRDVFDLRPAVGTDGVPLLSGVTVDHCKPMTSIGPASRPLVFPRAVLEYCRKMWVGERPISFFFAGLVTETRREVLNTWFSRALPHSRVFLPSPTRLSCRLQRKLRSVLRLPDASNVDVLESRDVVLWMTTRGRCPGIKAWDIEYYRMLGKSKYALCPRGDYPWTYRFFEAIMCGALPIVEDACPLYDGFTFLTTRDHIDNHKWSQAVAEHNFDLCRERLTVDRDVLNETIASMLE